MAVPSSGALSMRGIRNELYNNNYNASISFTNVSLNTMSTGGNGTINTANSSSNRPDGSTPHAMSEFYSYNHDETSTLASGTITVGVDNIYSSYFYGYGSAYFPNMGSISAGLAANSWAGITAFYWQNSNYLRIQFGSTPPTWNQLSINGQNQGSSSSFTTSGSQKYKYMTNNPMGTGGGTVSVVFS